MAKKKMFRSLYPRPVQAGERPLNYCGIRCSLEVLGGKWKLLIVPLLIDGPKRYGVLKRAIPEVSEKMLISSLQELEYHHLVSRTVLDTVPPHVEYALTDYGRQMLPLLDALYRWGEQHIAQHSDRLFWEPRA